MHVTDSKSVSSLCCKSNSCTFSPCFLLLSTVNCQTKANLTDLIGFFPFLWWFCDQSRLQLNFTHHRLEFILKLKGSKNLISYIGLSLVCCWLCCFLTTSQLHLKGSVCFKQSIWWNVKQRPTIGDSQVSIDDVMSFTYSIYMHTIKFYFLIIKSDSFFKCQYVCEAFDILFVL